MSRYLQEEAPDHRLHATQLACWASMRAKTRAKTEVELLAREGELSSALRRVLPEIERTGAGLFFNSEFDPHGLGVTARHETSETLYQLAVHCVELRVSLSLPGDRSVGQQFLSACHEHSDLGNKHRRGPRRLAAWLLEQVS